MDELDIASDRSELEREALLRKIMQRKPSGPEPIGECHGCGELVAGYKLFCDSDCACLYEKRKR